MAKYDGKYYSDFKSVSLGYDSVAGVLRFGVQATAALDDSDDRAIYVRGDNLYYWNGTSETNLGSGGGGGATTWEDLFADDITFNIASDGWTIAGGAGVGASDVLTLTAAAAVSGDVIQITNSGSGSDIKGTSDTWSVSKAGVAAFAKVDLGDDQAIEFGASDDAAIQWVGGSNVLDIAGATNFDGDMTIEAAHAVTIAGAGGATKLTITAGDAVLSDGSLSITDADNAETVTVINNTATTIGAAASAAVFQVESTSLTTGALVNAQLTEGTLNGGFYYSAWDATAGSRVFQVAEDGVTTIAGVAAGSNSVVVTSGDIFLSDTDASKLESEDGTGTLLTLDNKAGAIADNSAVLLVDAGGAVASGGNALRVAFTGTADAGAILAEFLPDAGSLGIKVDGGGIATQEALYIDADPTANSVAYIHSDAVIADNKALLELHQATGAMAGGSAGLRVDIDSTPAANVYGIEVDLTGVTATNNPGGLYVNGVGKVVKGILVDTDNTSVHAVQIDGSGALNAGRMLLVDNDGTPAAATDAVAEITFTGTATNNPVVLNVNNSTVDAAPLLVTSNVASATRAVGTFIQDSTTGAQSVVTLQQDDVSEEFIAFNSTAGSGQAVDLTNTTPAAVAGSVLVSAVDGTLYRLALYAAAGWSA